MRARALLIALVVTAVAAACVRLGFWQLDRLQQKRTLNARMRAALARPPVPFGSMPVESLAGRRVVIRGDYDERHQLLLAARTDGGAPGVHVVTPLMPATDDGDATTPRRSEAVLVDRGWLPSDDAATARPQEYPEPGALEVIGIADQAPRATRARYYTLEADSVELYSALRVDLDSLAARLPYALSPLIVRQLPGPGVPPLPKRVPPKPLDETMHLSYAIQWFLFAVILVVGSIALARSRRRQAGHQVP
jgi:surfeit locus 1 family protein